MNRVIKFRGKRIDNGEWVYGYLFKNWSRTFIHLLNGINSSHEIIGNVFDNAELLK